jgi:hypothetical protein
MPTEPKDGLWDLLERATVRVCDSTGAVRGSGFFVEPRRVLTAAHVVAEATHPLSLVLTSGRTCAVVNVLQAMPARKQAGHTVWPMPDLAVLSVDDETLDLTTPFVEMTDTTPSGEVLIAGTAMGLTEAIVDDRARLQYEAARKEAGFTLFKLAGNPIAPGMSGGPVLDPISGKVVGLVKADRGGHEGAFVIAGASIYRALPALWASHLEAHKRDATWRLEATGARYAGVDASALISYLQTLSSTHARSPMLPDGVERRQVRQPTRVRPRRAIGTQINTDDRLPQDAEGLSDVDDAVKPTGEAFLWDPLRSPWSSVAIVAGPGMGKTWLLAHHAVAIAEQSLQRLQESPALHVSVRVPVFVNAASFARRLDPDPDWSQVTEALSATLLRSAPTAPERDVISAMLTLALEDSRVVLCVDGLDEVPIDLRERLRASLAMLEPRLEQLIVSGRESARGTLERVFGGEHEEFELTGFVPGDIRRFVRSWHRSEPQLVGKVERILRESPGLRTLAHVPLLLNFVCRLAETSAKLASTRSGLYRDVALGVLSGRWRSPEPQITDPGARLRLLSAAVGPLAGHWRARPDEFNRNAVESALRAQPEYAVVRDAATERWRTVEGVIDRHGTSPPTAPVLWELMHDGLLIETSAPDGTPLLRFSHLVFGELCVAMWLAELPATEQAAEVELHRWFDGQWSEVIPIACGIAVDPAQLLSCLPMSDDDPWLTQAMLSANCMVEAPRAAGRETVEQLVRILIDRLNSGPVSDAPAARHALTVLLGGRVEHSDASLVMALRNREIASEEDKAFAMRLLCQLGESYAVAKCQEVVANRSRPQPERDKAAHAICCSDDASAVEIVITIYANQKGAHSHLAVVLASGDAASEAALALVRRRDVDQTLRVRVAVEQLEVNGIETAAFELLEDRMLGLSGQVALTVALLRCGQDVQPEHAAELIDDPNVTQSDRLELVHALLLRGGFSALPVAADLVIDLDLDYKRRRALAQTMASIGREGTQALHNSATLSSAAPAARLQALLALIERRHTETCRAAALVVINGEGEQWVQVQLLGSLLRNMPQMVDQEAVMSMLADRDLTDGQLHSSWEELAAIALAAGEPEVRANLRERIKRRVLDGEELTELSTIDVGRLFGLLAGSAQYGVDLFVEIAGDGAANVDTRILSAMLAVITDVGRVEELVGLLEDDGLTQAVRDRLAVAFAMLGALVMLPRVLGMLPGSEPAYVALRSILRGETIAHDVMREGVERGREALTTLRDGEQAAWDLDFSALAREFEIPASSQTERDLRFEWVSDQLRERTYARLSLLLLPAERLALYRVGGFADSEATRNWLATWIPGYREVARAEAARLKAQIHEHPDLLPSPFTGHPFDVTAAVSTLLREWCQQLDQRKWHPCLSLMAHNERLFGSGLPAAVHDVAAHLSPVWPDYTARQFLLSRAQRADGLASVRDLFFNDVGPLTAGRECLDEGDGPSAFGAASFAVFKSPGDAAGYFYAAQAMLLLEQPEQAFELMRSSAIRATARQASQGRRTLREFGERKALDSNVIEELREILGKALERADGEVEEDLDAAGEVEPGEREQPDDEGPETDDH